MRLILYQHCVSVHLRAKYTVTKLEIADEAQWMQSYKNVNYLYIYIGLEFCVMNGDLAIRSAIFEEALAKN
jgi:hypothetical protein